MIGDVNSNERGSGARYNNGKPDLSLIPLVLVARTLRPREDHPDDTAVVAALTLLGMFQQTGRIDYLDGALMALRPYWRDCAKVFEYGKKKYAAWNWAKGMPWSVALACAGRHALDHFESDTDDESEERHIGHLLCNVVMLRHFTASYPEGNDLPPPALFAVPPTTETESP